MILFFNFFLFLLFSMYLLALIYHKFVNLWSGKVCLDGGLFDIYGPIGAKIELMKWNCNSELPAALALDEELSSIQNWGLGNYHWYLKWKWSYFGQEQVNVCLNSERPMHGIFWTAYGLVCSLNLCWGSAVCDGFATLQPFQFQFQYQFLRLPFMFLFNLKFQSALQSGFHF